MGTNQAAISEIRKAIRSIPLIDNHAHNLLRSYEFPGEMLVSEATGSALKDAVYSLAHIRALKYLARFLGLPAESPGEQVKEAAESMDYTSFCQSLIKSSGIQTILIDDGFSGDKCFEISWHDQFTPFPNKRIVRIETLFESIVKESEHPVTAFINSIDKYANDPHVVGFKSIAAYRDGLDVEYQPMDGQTERAWVNQDITATGSSRYKVKKRETIRWLVNKTLSIISGKGKPIQFHTGLGDNDITLVRSDPSHLQSLIRGYPNVPFVILHSGYPYARQAGYLATVYSNVYLDFGLAIPFLSGDGQRSLMRQLLELCPTNKLLWSSDAVFYPERYYLGAVQTKDVMAEVLAENIARGDIHLGDAIKIAKRMLFENSNQLYNLGLAYTELDPEADPISTGLNNSAQPTMNDSPSTSLSSLVDALRSQGIKFVRLAWVDYVNLLRYRVIPIDHFVSIVGSQLIKTPSSFPSEQLAESGTSIVQAALGLVANDGLTPGVSTSGDRDLKPDFSSTWKPSYAPGHAYMMGRFFHKSHAGGAEFETCPRTILQRVVQRAERDFGAKFLVGFETEFILLDREGKPASTGAWSTSRKLQCGPVTDCVHEIAQTIIDAGIKLELYHAESADGQTI
ncbi:hypothetical protein FS749_007869 [Ceratobasidium sp. UAMH 11750]|nr:hypothetical protein FS749_007869 [Ceratobasidium sp. UAMH 11750]